MQVPSDSLYMRAKHSGSSCIRRRARPCNIKRESGEEQMGFSCINMLYAT